MNELAQTIQQAADEYSYNEWRNFPDNQAIANKGFIAGVEFLQPFYEKQKEINKELVDEIEALKREIEERKRYEEKLLRESFAPREEPPADDEDEYSADYYDGDEYSEGL